MPIVVVTILLPIDDYYIEYCSKIIRQKNYYIFMDGIQLSFLLSLYTLLFIRQQTTHTLLFFLQRLRWFSIEVITSVIFVFYSENTWKMRTILLYVDLFYFHASSSNENWLYCICWKNKNKARGVDNVLYVQQSWHKIYNYDIW